MWQAISRLLSEQLGEGEIELRNELPGGEVHAAWHLRYAGRDFFVKCDERELLPGFTAEADQLELLSRSKTVTVPKVWAVGADRDYSFLVMDYLPPRPLDAHSAFILGQQIARLHQWSDQPQFGLDFDNALSTTPQPNTWQRRWSTFFAEQRIGWQLELAAEKGIAFGNIDAIVEHIQQRLASHQPQPSLLHGDLWSGNCALGPDGPYIFDPACYWGDRECDLAVYLRQLPLHGFDGRKVVPERYHLPEIGVGTFEHLGCGLLQLQLRDLFAQPGELVAADDLQPCEQGLHGRDGTQDAAFYQRQGQRLHLRDREIGLHQPVLGLEYAARGRDLREIGGECLAARLQGGVEVEAAVFERAVMLHGRGAALVERERLGQARGGGHAQQEE